jgi:hypothetical protein
MGGRFTAIAPVAGICYRVDRNRLDIRFIDDAGNALIGRYVDLQ